MRTGDRVLLTKRGQYTKYAGEIGIVTRLTLGYVYVKIGDRDLPFGAVRERVFPYDPKKTIRLDWRIA